MYDYYKPFYLPTVETVTPFEAEFSDVSTVFFRVKYRIRKDCFVSRAKDKPPLTNIFSRNKEIFSGINFQKSNYRLLKEERQHEAFYDVITETYGFAPSQIYLRFGSSSVQFAGHTIKGDGSMILLSSFNVNYQAQEVYFTDVNSKTYHKGDYVYFSRPHFWEGTSELYHLVSNTVQLTDDNVAPIVTFSRASDGEDTGSKNPYGNKHVVFVKRVIQPKNDTVNVETRTQYFMDKPEIIKRTMLVDSAGNETLDATDATFATNAGLYDGKYNIEDSPVAFDNATGLWRRDIKLTEWKTF